MLDAKQLRADPAPSPPTWRGVGSPSMWLPITQLEEQRKIAQVESDRVRAERNANAKAVGMAKGKGEDASALLARAEELTHQLATSDAAIAKVQQELDAWQLGLPNTLHASVPEGRDESANVEVRKLGDAAELRLHAQGSRGARRKARRPRFRNRGEDLGRSLLGHARQSRAPASRARAVHARPAHARAWLYGAVCSLPGERLGAAGHGPASEVRSRPVPRAGRTQFLSHSHRRSARHQPGARAHRRSLHPADEVRGAHPVFPFRGRRGRARTRADSSGSTNSRRWSWCTS